MTTSVSSRSSWISSIAYRHVGRDRYLAIFISTEHSPIYAGERIPVAMLYANPPSWLPGLLTAGTRSPKTGERSVGRAYNLLLKDKLKLPYQRVEGQEKVSELRRMMGAV